MFLLEKG